MVENNLPTNTEINVNALPKEINDAEKKNKSRLLNWKVWLIVLILGIASIFSFVFLKSATKKLPPPESANVLLATVYGEEISTKDLNEFANANFGVRKLDSTTLKTILNVLIERKILDRVKNKNNWSIEGSQTANDTYYSKIRDQVRKGETGRMQAIDIGWWIPPPNEYEQLPIHDTQRREGELAASEIEERLKKNDEPVAILRDIYKKYNALQSILAINGQRYEGEKSESNLIPVRNYEYDRAQLYFPKYKVMYQMQAGEVKKNVWEDGSGADIIKVISISPGEKIGYNDWLKLEIEKNAKLNQEIINQL